MCSKLIILISQINMIKRIFNKLLKIDSMICFHHKAIWMSFQQVKQKYQFGMFWVYLQIILFRNDPSWFGGFL